MTANVLSPLPTSVVDRLLHGICRLDFLDAPWLCERMAEASPKFEAGMCGPIKAVFQELPFTPTWLAQAWALYAPFSGFRDQMPTRSEVGFLYFILGLKAGWPRQTTFTAACWEQAMKEGAMHAQQILTILHIFHENV